MSCRLAVSRDTIHQFKLTDSAEPKEEILGIYVNSAPVFFRDILADQSALLAPKIGAPSVATRAMAAMRLLLVAALVALAAAQQFPVPDLSGDSCSVYATVCLVRAVRIGPISHTLCSKRARRIAIPAPTLTAAARLASTASSTLPRETPPPTSSLALVSPLPSLYVIAVCQLPWIRGSWALLHLFKAHRRCRAPGFPFRCRVCSSLANYMHRVSRAPPTMLPPTRATRATTPTSRTPSSATRATA